MVGFKQFRDQCCLSYLLFDRTTRRGLLIDPNVELMSDYRQFLASEGIRLELLVDTHLHSEHYSATHLLRKETGARICMSEDTRSERVDRRLRGGEALELDALKLEVLATPGHTCDGISLHGHGMLFSGDAWLIGEVLPPELPGADPRAAWGNFHHKYEALPGGTLLYPAHDPNELLFSVRWAENKRSAFKKFPSVEEFARARNAVAIVNPPAEIQSMIDFNLKSEPTGFPGRPRGKFEPYGEPDLLLDRMAAISISKFAKKVHKPDPGTFFLDVRDPEEFRAGHIPKSRNIPVHELGLRFTEQLGKCERIYICGLADSRTHMAAKTLSYLGLPVVLVEGGVRAWLNAGYSVEEGD